MEMAYLNWYAWDTPTPSPRVFAPKMAKMISRYYPEPFPCSLSEVPKLNSPCQNHHCYHLCIVGDMISNKYHVLIAIHCIMCTVWEATIGGWTFAISTQVGHLQICHHHPFAKL